MQAADDGPSGGLVPGPNGFRSWTFVTRSRIPRLEWDLELARGKRVSTGCACEEGGDGCETRPGFPWFESTNKRRLTCPHSSN